MRLWYHECCRVFQDRLINDDDRNWFDKLLKQKIEVDFKLSAKQVLGDFIILYGDFIDPASDIRLYAQITDMEKVYIRCELTRRVCLFLIIVIECFGSLLSGLQ